MIKAYKARSGEVVSVILSIPFMTAPELKFQLTTMGRLKSVMSTASVSVSPTNTLMGVGPAGVMTAATVTELRLTEVGRKSRCMSSHSGEKQTACFFLLPRTIFSLFRKWRRKSSSRLHDTILALN